MYRVSLYIGSTVENKEKNFFTQGLVLETLYSKSILSKMKLRNERISFWCARGSPVNYSFLSRLELIKFQICLINF